ncbi:MAG: ankyrin repeat domain-containing protein, partial [Hyphomicrobium sp.]
MNAKSRYLVGLGSALLLSAGAAPGAQAAKVRICQGQEQAYEQIKAGATTLQVNAALFSAADKGCVELARQLLADGASLKARDRFGASALSRAATSGKAELVDLFLQNGAAIDARNIDGSTALFLAAEAGNWKAVDLLIARGADVNLLGRTGLTPLDA